MIKEGQYAMALGNFLRLSPPGAHGPWQRTQVVDFYEVVQTHLPPGIQWFALEYILSRIPINLIKTKADVARLVLEQGIQPHYVRLHVRAYEELRRIFALTNGFEHVPLPTGRAAMPPAKEVGLRGQYVSAQIRPFYETCMCGACVATRLEVERQARVRNGEEDDDDDEPDNGF
jgi:hypothetical protein